MTTTGAVASLALALLSSAALPGGRAGAADGPPGARREPTAPPSLQRESRLVMRGLFALTPEIALELVPPMTWGIGSQPNDEGRLDSLLFAPGQSEDYTVRVSPFPFPGEVQEPRRARELAEAMRGGVRGAAGPMREFHGERATVHWFSVPTTRPGSQFKWLSAGAAAVGELLLNFNLLHNDDDPPERALVLQALGRARQVDAAARAPATVSLAFGGKPWALLVDVPGLAIEKVHGKADGSRMLQARSESTGILISIFLEPAPGPGGAAECRAAYFDKALASPIEKTGVTRSQRGAMAIGEYLVPRAEGMEVRQKHLNAYLVRDGVWMDVHVSRTGFQPADQAVLDRLVSSIRFSDG